MQIQKAAMLAAGDTYGPNRYREMAVWSMADLLAKDQLVQRDGMMVQRVPGMIMDMLVIPTMEQAVEHVTRAGEDPQTLAEIAAKMFESRHWVPLLAQFIGCGEPVFDVQGKVDGSSAMDDAAYRALNPAALPHHAIFLHLGKQDQASRPFDQGVDEFVDGAFVARTPSAMDSHGNPSEYRLRVGLTTVKTDGTGVQMMGYFLDFLPAELGQNYQQAIASSMQRRIDGFKQGQDSVPGLDEVRELHVREGGQLMQAVFPTLCRALYMVTR